MKYLVVNRFIMGAELVAAVVQLVEREVTAVDLVHADNQLGWTGYLRIE